MDIFDVNSVLRETSDDGTLHIFWFATPEKNKEIKCFNIQGVVD